MKKFLNILFFILITLLFTALILILEARLTILKPEFIKTQLSENQTYQKVLDNSGVLIDEFLKNQKNGSFLQNLPFGSKEISTFIIKKAIQPSWLQKTTEYLIDNTYSFVFSDKKEPDFVVSLENEKTKIKEATESLLSEKYYQLPEFSEKEYKKLIDEKKFFLARPAGISFEEFLVRAETNVGNLIAENMPSNLNFDYIKAKNTQIKDALDQIERIRMAEKLLNIVFYILLFITFGLIILVSKLTSKSLVEFLSKMGGYFLVGFFIFLLFLIVQYVTNWLLIQQLYPKFIQISEPIKNEIVIPFIKSTQQQIFRGLLTWSGILGLFGIILLAPGIYKKFKNKLNK